MPDWCLSLVSGLAVNKRRSTYGAPSDAEKEWSEFYDYARDKNDPNKVYYEDYVAKLTGFVDRHIETIYAPTRSN